jgi:hypothetical protein
VTDSGEVLPGGRFVQACRFARPVRRGDTVERTPGPGRANVHALLAHLSGRASRRPPGEWGGYEHAEAYQAAACFVIGYRDSLLG